LRAKGYPPCLPITRRRSSAQTPSTPPVIVRRKIAKIFSMQKLAHGVTDQGEGPHSRLVIEKIVVMKSMLFQLYTFFKTTNFRNLRIF